MPVQYPDLPEPNTEETAGARQVTPPSFTTHESTVHQSPGTQSSISAITAISTAQSVHDPGDLDTDSMLEFLDDLFTDAGKVLDIVAPKTASTENLASVVSNISNPHSPFRQVLEKRVSRFVEVRENFGTGDYINQATVLEAFARKTNLYEPGGEIARPDTIIYKANLATFAKQMVTLEQEDNDIIFSTLVEADNTFPRRFLPSLYDSELEEPTPGSSALVQETFQLALDIRTQVAVYLLVKRQHDQGFDPDNMLRIIFFAVPDEEGEEDDMSEMHRLRGWEILGLGSGDDDLSELIKNPILRRIEHIRHYFRGGQEALEHGDYVDSDALMAAFPWSDFIIHVLNWARIRNTELQGEINTLGGVSAIHASLKEHLETDTQESRRRSGLSQSQGGSTTERESQSQQIPKTSTGVISALRRRLARLSGQDHPVEDREPAELPSEPVPTESAVSQAEQDDYQPPVLGEEEAENEDEDDSRTFVNSLAERSTQQGELDILRQREKQNKENMRRVSVGPSNPPRKSLYDRQPGATKVSFEESPMSSAKETSPPRKSPRKRTSAQTDTDTDDDEDEFERRVPENRRKAPVSKQARYAPSAPPSSARKQSQARRTPAVAEETQPAESSDEEEAMSAAAQLKAVARQANRLPSSHPGKVSGKRPWTDDETNAFMAYVEEFRGSKQIYKRIKDEDAKRDNVLANRDNVALKDKAININKIYHKCVSLEEYTLERVVLMTSTGLATLLHRDSSVSPLGASIGLMPSGSVLLLMMISATRSTSCGFFFSF